MSVSEKNRLSDEALELVTGGTNKEMHELQDALNASNLSDITKGLKAKGITAELSTNEKNKYTRKDQQLSHTDVLSIIRQK